VKQRERKIMDEILTAPAERQPAVAQPDARKEWTAPTLKKVDLAETRFGADFLDDGSGLSS
jgi:hypothetical protein